MKGTPHNLPRRAPRTTLDAWMREQSMTNDRLAEQVREVRGHNTSPQKARVSEWRNAKVVPSYETRRIINMITGGRVPMHAWANRARGRKKRELQ